ncbi:MAG: hypothetical protein ACKVY0_27590 [Prosthecobacter sp.]|uniref:hypothetical protein n=1 Tax=Prosthecobacter sp. TaxID=1965333 RepID=UPI0039015102
MKLPVVYDLNVRRRCLLVQDGQTITIGRSATCTISIDAESVQDVELSAQFVNNGHFVIVTPTNGSVPYAQPLPWQFTLGGMEVVMIRPTPPAKSPAGKVQHTLTLQGLASGTLRHAFPPDQPLLLGSSTDCDVILTEVGCPPALLACWATAENQIFVQVLDDSTVVSWLGRAGETEAMLNLPASVSLGGRMLLISNDAAKAPKAPAVVIKPTPQTLSIVAKQVPALHRKDGVDTRSTRTPQPTLPAIRHSLPLPTNLAAPEGLSASAQPEIATETASLTGFILASWLLLGLTVAVACLPELEPLVWAADALLLLLTVSLGGLVLAR